MVNLKRSAAAIGVLTAVLMPVAGSADPVSRATLLSISCAGCHGPDGVSAGAIPSLTGHTAEYLEQALLQFRSGERQATVMNRHATGYSEEEIKLIARYFADKRSQP